MRGDLRAYGGGSVALIVLDARTFGGQGTFGGQVKCRSFVSLSISSLKTFARLRTRRFAPAMPTPTSFSFTLPAYLTCPSKIEGFGRPVSHRDSLEKMRTFAHNIFFVNQESFSEGSDSFSR